MNDLRIRIADEISGIVIGTGYESTTIGINAALEAADALIAAGIVAEEPDGEYSVVHVQVDGWVERELHLNRQEALDDYGTCGMNCTLMRRRKTGPWEPVEN